MITQEQLEYLLNHGLTTEMIEKITADLAQLDKQAIGREYKQMKRNNMSTHSILPIFWTDEQRQAEKSARSNRQSVDVGWQLPFIESQSQPAPVSAERYTQGQDESSPAPARRRIRVTSWVDISDISLSTMESQSYQRGMQRGTAS